MRVLLVIHGYPMRFNAGSEVYTQTLARGLADRHEVRVFTRQEDASAPPYSLVDEVDDGDPRVALRVINNAASRDRYRHDEIDDAFDDVLNEFRPNIVHVGHLSHLSTSLVQRAARRGIPMVYTLHDFWLMCPRGQFIQRTASTAEEPFSVCHGQEDRKCAQKCYSLYFSGATELHESESATWTSWVRERMSHVRQMTDSVDRFIAPSQHLLARYRDEFGIPAEKLAFLDYGFDHKRLSNRSRQHETRFVFGYIGTHTPAKGIHHLLDAFARLTGNALLRIWGRTRDPYTSSLRNHAESLPGGAGRRVEWMGEYRNERIVAEVFDHADTIVVPSIWEENSPLVIHEAQHARVPVVTADVGGMAEYVQHEVNGLLFRHRDSCSMAEQMQRLLDEPDLARGLGARGYLRSATGDAPSIEAHVRSIEAIYSAVIRDVRRARSAKPGPWRITFDTNPDDCNLRCVMCEEHSPHSTLQAKRRATGTPKRRMDVALIRRVLEDARGTPLREIIPSTMGEPLLYEHFDEVLSLCREFGVKLNLTTNGTFPRLGARAWAERIVPVTSDVKLSWNGATKQTHESVMLGICWESAVENLREFVAVRDAHAAAGGNYCRVTLQATFLESNIAELPEMVRLAAALGVDRVKGHHVWVHFDQLEGESLRRSHEAIARWNNVVEEAERAAIENQLPSGKPVLLENIHRLDPAEPQDIVRGGECPFLGQEAWVSAEGRFNPCCAPDALRRTLGDFGNLQERTLSEVWTGSQYGSLRENYMENRLCQTCNMRRPASSK